MERDARCGADFSRAAAREVAATCRSASTCRAASPGMTFKDHYAFLSGWGGITVLDIAQADVAAGRRRPPAAALRERGRRPVRRHPPDRERPRRGRPGRDPVRDRHRQPDHADAGRRAAARLTGAGRGPGHIANFVKPRLHARCGSTAATTSRSSTSPSPPRRGRSARSRRPLLTATTFRVVPRHRARQHGHALVRRRRRRRRLPADRRSAGARCSLGHDGDASDGNPSPYNDFILHNSQRRGKTLLVTEEDYVDTERGAAGRLQRPGQVRDVGHLAAETGAIMPLDTWQTELNGIFAGGAEDSKAPVTANCSSHWFDAQDGVAAVGWYEQGVRFLDVRNPERHPPGRLLPPGRRRRRGRRTGRRPTRTARSSTPPTPPAASTCSDRQWRDHRQEGQGAGAQRVVRQPGHRRRVVRATPDLRVRLPGAEGRRQHAIGSVSSPHST